MLDGNRILRFDNAATLDNGANANGVLGQPNFNTGTENNGQSGLGDPSGIFVSATGTLWVASTNLHRVSRFASAATKPNGADADSVLGRPDFSSARAGPAPPTGRGTFDHPRGVAVDLAGNLYVADSWNHRVLKFENADALPKGSDASVVLVQLFDHTKDIGAGALGMDTLVSVAVSPNGTLFVSDMGNNRLLLFFNVVGDGGAADGVLGHDDLETPGPSESDRKFQDMNGIWVDGDRRVWIADKGLSRVLRFDTDRFQPDAQIGLIADDLLGNDRFNGTGVGEQVRLKVVGRKTGRAFLKFQNDGDVSDDLILSASKGNRFVKAQYVQPPGGNATAAITAGQFILDDVAAGATASLQLRATGERKFASRAGSLKSRVVVTSSGDGSLDRIN